VRGQAAGRVIVGVDDSLAGLQALREAAGLARSRGRELLALRACRPPLADADFSCWPDAGPDPAFTQPPPRDLCEQLTRSFVDHAFSEAMDGMPGDVPVDTLIAYERPHRALAAAAHQDADLPVVGASRHHSWWPLRRSVGRYCAAHVGCPVLIVPPHQAARELDRTWRPWTWLKGLRRRREFSSLLAGISS
jgi:nucleotide-binding universal stress UspA family protein